MALTNLVLSSSTATAAALRQVWVYPLRYQIPWCHVDMFLLCSVLHVCGLVSSLALWFTETAFINIERACMGVLEVSACPFTYSVMR